MGIDQRKENRADFKAKTEGRPLTKGPPTLHPEWAVYFFSDGADGRIPSLTAFAPRTLRAAPTPISETLGFRRGRKNDLLPTRGGAPVLILLRDNWHAKEKHSGELVCVSRNAFLLLACADGRIRTCDLGLMKALL